MLHACRPTLSLYCYLRQPFVCLAQLSSRMHHCITCITIYACICMPSSLWKARFFIMHASAHLCLHFRLTSASLHTLTLDTFLVLRGFHAFLLVEGGRVPFHFNNLFSNISIRPRITTISYSGVYRTTAPDIYGTTSPVMTTSGECSSCAISSPFPCTVLNVPYSHVGCTALSEFVVPRTKREGDG